MSPIIWGRVELFSQLIPGIERWGISLTITIFQDHRAKQSSTLTERTLFPRSSIGRIPYRTQWIELNSRPGSSARRLRKNIGHFQQLQWEIGPARREGMARNGEWLRSRDQKSPPPLSNVPFVYFIILDNFPAWVRTGRAIHTHSNP